MSDKPLQRAYRLVGVLVMVYSLAATLTGCGRSANSPASGAAAGPLLQGKVMGGRQTISGASVVLYAASGTYFGDVTEIAHATSDATGNYSFSSFTATPSSGDLVYALSDGGNTGAGVNANARLMSLVGVWNGSSFSNNFLVINELTTVTMLETLGSTIAMVNCTNIGITISSGLCPKLRAPLAIGDWNSSVQAVTKWLDLSHGSIWDSVRFTTSDPTGKADYDLLTLDMLASVLANCVNSTGGSAGDSSACGNLFSKATDGDGTASNTAVTTAKVTEISYTGYSNPTPPSVNTAANSINAMTFSPNGKTLYLAYNSSFSYSFVTSYALDVQTGQLSLLSSSDLIHNGLNETNGSLDWSILANPRYPFVYTLNNIHQEFNHGINTDGSITGGTPNNTNVLNALFGSKVSSTGNFVLAAVSRALGGSTTPVISCNQSDLGTAPGAVQYGIPRDTSIGTDTSAPFASSLGMSVRPPMVAVAQYADDSHDSALFTYSVNYVSDPSLDGCTG